jgi:hypothetical protein
MLLCLKKNKQVLQKNIELNLLKNKKQWSLYEDLVLICSLKANQHFFGEKLTSRPLIKELTPFLNRS